MDRKILDKNIIQYLHSNRRSSCGSSSHRYSLYTCRDSHKFPHWLSLHAHLYVSPPRQ